MGFFDDIFSGGEGKARNDIQDQFGHAQDYLKQGEQRGEDAYSPYWNSRGDIFNEFRDALHQGQDPSKLLNQYMNAYQESPQIKAQIAEGTHAANASANATGMAGSPAAMQQAAANAQGLRAQDMNSYVNKLLGVHSQYLSGIGGLEQQGMGMSGDVAHMRQQLGMSQAQLSQELAKALAAGDTGKASFINKLLGSAVGAAAKVAMMP